MTHQQNLEEKIRKPEEQIFDAAMTAMEKEVKQRGDINSLSSIAADILRMYPLPFSARELASLYRRIHPDVPSNIPSGPAINFQKRKSSGYRIPTFLKREQFEKDDIHENVTTSAVPGAGDDNSVVPVRKKRRKTFDVPHHIYKRFSTQKRKKHESWTPHLSVFDPYEKSILEYIRKNRNHEVAIKSQETLDELVITHVDEYQ